MKNLKRMLGLLVVSVMAISVMGTAKAASGTPCSGDACHIRATIVGSKEGSETATYGDLTDVVAEIKDRVDTDGEKITKVDITLLADTVLSGSDTFKTDGQTHGTGITCPVTINLAGYELDVQVASPFVVVKGGSLTINGSGTGSQVAGTVTTLVSVQRGGTFKTTGKVTYALDDNDTFVVADGTTASSGRITIITDASTTVESAKVAFDTTAYADITVAGNYDLQEQLVKVGTNNSKVNASVINVNATTSSVKANALLVGGYAKLTVNGGKYTADGADNSVVSITAISDVTINNGTFTATSGSSTLDTGYAVRLGAGATIKINGGTFTSGEDTVTREYLPALFITDIAKNKGNVTAGTFNYGMVASSTTSGGEGNPDADKNTEDLVATTSTYTVNKDDKTVVVKAGAASDPEKDPEKPGTSDDQPSENPKTFDAIGSLVTMAISSLGVVGTATKKMFK